MLRVAIKGVLARKVRLVLTSIAIVLGVGFVSGAFLFTDSMRQSFDSLFTEAAEGIDVQVQSKELKELAEAAQKNGPAAVPIDLAKVGVPPAVVDRMSGVPGVKKAAGSIFELGAQPLDKQGKPIGQGGAPSFAANWVPEAEDIGALRIVKGDAPDRDEVMLDATVFKKGDFKLGDTVRVLIQSGRKTESFRISGVVKFGSANNLNGASITVFETSRIQGLLDMGDRFTAAQAQAENGVSQTELKRRIKAQLGADYDVITGAEFTQEQTASIDDAFLGVLQNFILTFAAVAVFVGAFTIFNTFTILVGQRVREFGLLRAIGASRKQVLGIVVLESLVTGVLASTLGLAAGYGIAALLRTLLNAAFDGGIPTGPFPLETRTVVWSYAVGVIVTLVASLLPAWRASRLSPLEALRSNSAHAGRGWKVPAFGTLLILGGVGLAVTGFRLDDDASTSSVLTRIGVGAALAIVGIALASRLFIVPVAKVLARPLALGTTGDLATRNVLRNRARSATTSSALMIGLALASLLFVFYASLGATVDRQINDILGADITVYNSTALQTGIGSVDQESIDVMERTKGVDLVAGQRYGSTTFGKRFDVKRIETLVAFDSEALAEDGIVALDITKGSADPGSGVLVDSDLAKERKLAVGDELTTSYSTGITRKLRVEGVYEPNQIVGSQLITSIDTFDALEPASARAAAGVYIRVDDDVKAGTVVKRIKHDLGKRATFLEIQDSEGLRDTFDKQLQPVLGIVLAMLSLSLIIALFGIGNTLALNVFERTREIGLIRAIGGTRRQVRRIIRVESVLVALFGAFVGVLVGLAAGKALVAALADEGFVFAVSWPAIAAVLIVGFVAGILASILPARRAARTDVLAAIAAE